MIATENNVFTKLEKIIAFFDKYMVYLATIILGIMTALVAGDTIGRYFFNKPIVGVLEVTSYLFMVALLYLTISHNYAQDGNIKIEVLSKHFPKSINRGLNIIFNLIVLVIFSIIFYKYGQKVMTAIQNHESINGGIALPIAPCYSLVILGSLFLCIRILLRIFKLALNIESPDKGGEDQRILD